MRNGFQFSLGNGLAGAEANLIRNMFNALAFLIGGHKQFLYPGYLPYVPQKLINSVDFPNGSNYSIPHPMASKICVQETAQNSSNSYICISAFGKKDGTRTPG